MPNGTSNPEELYGPKFPGNLNKKYIIRCLAQSEVAEQWAPDSTRRVGMYRFNVRGSSLRMGILTATIAQINTQSPLDCLDSVWDITDVRVSSVQRYHPERHGGERTYVDLCVFFTSLSLKDI